MAKIAVVTDSVACIPLELVEKYGIHVIPFQLIWDGITYLDGESLKAEDFYRRLRQSKTHPTTSQPPVGAFTSLYQSLASQVDGIVSIHVSGFMTGAVRTAQTAALEVKEVKGIPIRVIDSQTATMAEGFVVLAAARAAAAGASLAQAVAAAESVMHRVNFYATLETLEHIRRGGRLGELALQLGANLHVVPILHLKNGRVVLVTLSRSRRRALGGILELAAREIGDRPIHASVFHGDALPEAKWMAEEVRARFNVVEFYITEFTPVMGAHTGPGVIGFVFYPDED